MTIFEWNITELETITTSEPELVNVVSVVEGSMGCIKDGVISRIPVRISLPKPTSSEGFTAYSDITQAETILWLEATMSDAELQALKDKAEAECDALAGIPAASEETSPKLPWQ